jgi:hypothetical protein
MKKLMAAAAGALLIAGQVTSAMAATSDAVAATAPNARVAAASYCSAPARHQMTMSAQARTRLANRCDIATGFGGGGFGGGGFLFAGLILVGVVAVAVGTNNKNKPTSP